MRVYHALPIALYSSPKRASGRHRIRQTFGKDVVFVKPGKDLDKLAEIDALVFTRYFGRVTYGVGREIVMALGLNKPVYEETKEGLIRVTKPVTFLNQEDTNALYRRRQLVERMLQDGKQSL